MFSEPDRTYVNVLLADDAAVIRSAVSRLLEAEPAIKLVGVAENFSQTLQMAASLRPDVVLLDLHMPELDGISFLEQLHEQLAFDVFLPVIVLSADVTPESKHRVLAAGAKDFLTKPLDRFEVICRVRNTLETAHFYKAVSRRNTYLQGFIEDRTNSERVQL